MKDLTQGNIYKTFVVFALPMVLAALLSQAYNLVDTVIAGRWLGSGGLAALGATSPLIQFVSSLFWGYNQGFAIYMARLFGAREYAKIKRGVRTGVLLNVAAWAVIAGLLLLLRDPVFDLLRVDPAIRADAFDYFAIYAAGLFFIMMSANGVYLLNAFGSGTFPFVMSALSAILNLVGDIFCVTVRGWGIRGLAASTVFSAAAVSVCYFLKLRRCFGEMGVGALRVGVSMTEIREGLPYSMPSLVQQSAMYLATLVLAPAVNGLGSAASAAYTVVNKVYNVNAVVYQNSAKTLSNYTAQCVGARKWHRIRRGIGVALVQGVLFVAPFLLASVFFPRAIVSLFLSREAEDAGAITAMAVTFMTVFLPFVLFNLVNNLFHCLFRGLRQMRFLMASTFVSSAVRIACSYLLVGAMGMNGFYLGWVLSWVAEALFCGTVFVSGRWMPPEMRAAEAGAKQTAE